MSNKIAISIIIPTFNNVELTLKCLGSINKQSLGTQVQTIIVDNNSKDGTVQKIKKAYPKVKILAQNKNLKFSQSINLGAKSAKGKYLFISNNDVELEPDFLEKVFDFARKDPQIGVIGGKIISKSKGSNYQDSPANISRLTSEIKRLQDYGKTQEVDWITGAGLFVKKYIFDLLEGFDTNFPFYFEDLDFCFRVKQLGLKIVYFPKAKMVHMHSATASLKPAKWKNDVWYFGKIYFIRKHFPYWAKPVAMTAQTLFCLYMLVKGDSRVGSLLKAYKTAKMKQPSRFGEKRTKITKQEINNYYSQGKVFTARNSAPLQQVIFGDFYENLNRKVSTKKWHVLEFGVGHGWNLPLMVKYFGKITGVDIAPSAIEESKEYGFKNVDFAVLSGEKLPFKNNSFDFIVAAEVLEHVADLEKTVSEFKRVVKPGGYILVSVPAYLNLRGISKKIMEAKLGIGSWEPARSHPGGFERFLTPGKILKHFDDLSIVDTRGSHYGIAWSPPMIPLYPESLSPFFDYTLGKFPPLKRFGMAFIFLAQKN